MVARLLPIRFTKVSASARMRCTPSTNAIDATGIAPLEARVAFRTSGLVRGKLVGARASANWRV